MSKNKILEVILGNSIVALTGEANLLRSKPLMNVLAPDLLLDLLAPDARQKSVDVED